MIPVDWTNRFRLEGFLMIQTVYLDLTQSGALKTAELHYKSGFHDPERRGCGRRIIRVIGIGG